jgi:hypothetical protein
VEAEKHTQVAPACRAGVERGKLTKNRVIGGKAYRHYPKTSPLPKGEGIDFGLFGKFHSPARQAGPTLENENEQSIQTSLERRTRRSATSRIEKCLNFRENSVLAFSIFEQTPKTRELGQCILWKNFAPNAKNTENRPFSQMLKKIFWRRGKKFS